MPYDDGDEPDYDHETILEAVVRTLLISDDLDELSRGAGAGVLIDRDGGPVLITSADTYAAAGVMTLDKGVYLHLSDGSCFALTIGVNSRGHGDTTVRPPDGTDPYPTDR